MVKTKMCFCASSRTKEVVCFCSLFSRLLVLGQLNALMKKWIYQVSLTNVI